MSGHDFSSIPAAKSKTPAQGALPRHGVHPAASASTAPCINWECREHPAFTTCPQLPGTFLFGDPEPAAVAAQSRGLTGSFKTILWVG